MVASDDERRTFVRQKIADKMDSEDPRVPGPRSGVLSKNAQGRSKETHKLVELRSAQRQPVIRLRSRRGHRALDHVQPVHLAVRIAALGEIADVADISRKTRIQKVGVER